MQRLSVLPDEWVETRSETAAPPWRVPATKLLPARLRTDAIPRQHIIDLIDADPDRRIVVIEAPAGYGKSTLASQWVATAGVPCAWLSLDEWDNEPAQFFASLVAALQTIESAIGASGMAQLSRLQPQDDHGFVASLVDDLARLTDPCALVLDDFHNVTGPGLLQSTAVLLRNLPPSMRALILTRNEPGLPLSRFRSRGELLEIDFRDLRFSHNEATAFLHRDAEIGLTSQEIVALNERTEGWPVGLRLAQHRMKRESPEHLSAMIAQLTRSRGPVEGYLWEEVLTGLPSELSEFLSTSSIFDRFSAELCDSVFGTGSSTARIRELDAAGLFLISLDDENAWFRYHHLFREVLRNHLHKTASSNSIASLHHRAARWFARQGLTDEAIRHAVASQDWPLAVELLEPVAKQLYAADLIGALQTQLVVLPPSALSDHPELSFMLAWATGRSGRPAASLASLETAERAWIAAGQTENLGRVASFRAFHAAVRSEFDESVAHAERALELLPESMALDRALAAIFRATTYVLLGRPADAEACLTDAAPAAALVEKSPIERLDALTLGTIYVLRGRLRDAEALLRHATRSDARATFIQIQHALSHLGMVLLELNRIEEAEQCFSRGLRLSDEAGTLLWRGRMYFGLALVALAQSDLDEALEEAGRAISAWEVVGSPNELGKAQALRARLWLASDQPSLAIRWADQFGFSGGITDLRSERRYEYATFVRVLLAEGKPTDALDLIDRLRTQAVADERTGDVIELDMLSAIALKHQGDEEGALDSLGSALIAAESCGCIRLFADEGEKIASLLRLAVSARGNLRDSARRLLAAIEQTGTPNQGQDALSEREIEVLRLAASGLSNRAIGDRLFITEKTVKKHVSNVLAKLDASNRTEAVDKARRMGLLRE
ncbi:MAG: hypothetical protein KF883_03125 [Thermomicrobiales bacterium]|nr:hypothetical protein [Thermomicrobiales bacterium]